MTKGFLLVIVNVCVSHQSHHSQFSDYHPQYVPYSPSPRPLHLPQYFPSEPQPSDVIKSLPMFYGLPKFNPESYGDSFVHHVNPSVTPTPIQSRTSPSPYQSTFTPFLSSSVSPPTPFGKFQNYKTDISHYSKNPPALSFAQPGPPSYSPHQQPEPEQPFLHNPKKKEPYYHQPEEKQSYYESPKPYEQEYQKPKDPYYDNYIPNEQPYKPNDEQLYINKQYEHPFYQPKNEQPSKHKTFHTPKPFVYHGPSSPTPRISYEREPKALNFPGKYLRDEAENKHDIDTLHDNYLYQNPVSHHNSITPRSYNPEHYPVSPINSVTPVTPISPVSPGSYHEKQLPPFSLSITTPSPYYGPYHQAEMKTGYKKNIN